MNPTFQKKFKVIRQDAPYFSKKFQSNLLRWTLLSKKNSKLFVKMNPTFQKKFKVICRDEPYFPKKIQSNLSRWTLLLQKISK